MRAALLLALCLSALLAADQPAPVQLDPSKPADAVLIIDGLTRQLQLPREQAVALTMAIQTVGGVVREQAEAKAKAAEPKPVDAPAKPKG
jgi:hypothetical protein